MGAGLSIEGFEDGVLQGFGGGGGVQGFSGTAMNLNHWVDGVWDSSWVAESWGGVSEGGAVESSTYGGGGARKGRKVRLPRKWSDEEQITPIRPEIIVAAAVVQPPANQARELYLALEKRAAKRDRMKKIASIAIAFMDR